MQNERKQIFMKHKFRGVHWAEPILKLLQQRERTKPPEVDSLESSPSRVPMKDICTRLGWQIAWGNQQAGSIRLDRAGLEGNTTQTRQHAKL